MVYFVVPLLEMYRYNRKLKAANATALLIARLICELYERSTVQLHNPFALLPLGVPLTIKNFANFQALLLHSVINIGIHEILVATAPPGEYMDSHTN